MVEAKELRTALKQSNFILYALQGKIDEDYKETIENTIELNKKILASMDLQDQPAKEKKPYNPTSNELEIRNDLLVYGLMTRQEVEDNKNISLVRQLKNYKEKDTQLYLQTMDKIRSYASKNKLDNLQAYIIGAMKKEYAKREQPLNEEQKKGKEL